MELNDFQCEVAELVDVHAEDGEGIVARILSSATDLAVDYLDGEAYRLVGEAHRQNVKMHLSAIFADLSSLATEQDIDLQDLADEAIKILRACADPDEESEGTAETVQ